MIFTIVMYAIAATGFTLIGCQMIGSPLPAVARTCFICSRD